MDEETLPLSESNSDMDEQVRRKLTREEYEMQFFGFSHTMFNNFARSLIKDEISFNVASLKDNLKHKFSGEMTEEDLNVVRDRILQLYMDSSKAPLSNLEKVIGECVSIPEHVLLPEDEAYQRNQHPGVQMDELDKQIRELECRVVKAKYMESRLKEELAIIDSTVDLGTRKVNEIKERAHAIKQKSKRSKELIEKLVFTKDSDSID